MTNTEDFEQIFSKDEIAERRNFIKKSQADKFNQAMQERLASEEKARKERDSGLSRIIITKHPRPPTKKEVRIEPKEEPLPEEPEELIEIIDEMLSEEEEEIDEIARLKAKIEELEKQKTGE